MRTVRPRSKESVGDMVMDEKRRDRRLMREQERKLGEKNAGDKYTCKELVEKKKGVTEEVKKWEG